jgi:hypothetical protein
MTDETTPQTNGQATPTSNVSFFGGEANFNDSNAFKPVDAPDDFADFNPFEETNTTPSEAKEAPLEPVEEPEVVLS